ncbi:MAG: DNA primase DnaG [Candidatus Aenigmatarchaeota archaeon]
MSKLSQNFAKYVIRAKVEANGVVEKSDVIGAIFGQTEGLLGWDLDLRELQRTGRIGRIEVRLKVKEGKTIGEITIPSSLDMTETSLIGASLETIEKIGPCDAIIEVKTIEDIRTQKRKYVIERAKDLLKTTLERGGEHLEAISEKIKESVRIQEITSYEGLSCGPGIENYDEIIMVEGRADVINLLKNGIKNVIAIEGAVIPQAIIDLSKKKTVTVFVDGDRGGELILKKLLSVADIDYVARAPPGKEVEELTKKEIFKALREAIPADQVKRELLTKPPQPRVSIFLEESEKEMKSEEKELMKRFLNLLEDLVGTRASYLINKEMEIIAKIPVGELDKMINEFSDVYAIILDLQVSQYIVDISLPRKIKYIVGLKKDGNIKTDGIIVLDENDIRKIIEQ